MTCIPEKPKRVLMCADTLGGVWTYAMELAQGLTKTGIQVAVATLGRTMSSAQSSEARRIRGLTIFESEYKLEWMPSPWRDLEAAADWLLNLEERFQPDVVHLNNLVHGALPWQSPVVVAGHSCVLSWWEAVHQESAPSEWDRYSAAVRKSLQAADAVIAPSKAMMKALQKHYGKFRKSEVIYNGRNCPGALAPKEPLILAAGRLWDPAKNLVLLDKAGASLAWPIYVAGDSVNPDGTGETSLRNIRLLGKLSSELLEPWFARASVYVMPARYEPFGLSILEAALAGCALVLGNIESLREIWGDAALYIDPDSSSDLKEAMAHYIADPGLRIRMAHIARERANLYSSQTMTSAYLHVYQDLITSSRVAQLSASAGKQSSSVAICAS